MRKCDECLIMRLNKQISEGDNPDITEERLQSTFDTDALAAELKGGYDVGAPFYSLICSKLVSYRVNIEMCVNLYSNSFGTNLSKIETVANYDKTKEEFILHSPTTTSMKWYDFCHEYLMTFLRTILKWPGGLGKSCNHAVVVANLVIEEENFGPHNFMVQLRDIETHKPLKGNYSCFSSIYECFKPL
uniref:HECT domain-containing protein n=1 Tax=Heterorhabditis bacteriophora TaxID=37862 RepID=A0A1I7WK19_HETBA